MSGGGQDDAARPSAARFLDELTPARRPWDSNTFSILLSKPSANWLEDDLTGPVRHQGVYQTCTAHSVAAMVEAWNKKRGNQMSLSGPYIHLCLCSADWLVGVDPYRVMRLAVGKASPPYNGQQWPANACGVNQGAIIPPLRPIVDVAAAKAAISNMSPVVTGMDITTAFNDLTMYDYVPNGLGAGQHCVCVIGYDKTGWIIQNSYGHKWGKEGFSRVPYGVGRLFSGVYSAIAIE